MVLNDVRHDEAWTRVWEEYYARFCSLTDKPSLVHDRPLLERFRTAVGETTYLFNEANDEEDFGEALKQMREVLEMRLVAEKARRGEVA